MKKYEQDALPSNLIFSLRVTLSILLITPTQNSSLLSLTQVPTTYQRAPMPPSTEATNPISSITPLTSMKNDPVTNSACLTRKKNETPLFQRGPLRHYIYSPIPVPQYVIT